MGTLECDPGGLFNLTLSLPVFYKVKKRGQGLKQISLVTSTAPSSTLAPLGSPDVAEVAAHLS